MTALNSPKLDIYQVHVSTIRQVLSFGSPVLSCIYRHRHLPSDVDFRQSLHIYGKGFGDPQTWRMRKIPEDPPLVEGMTRQTGFPVFMWERPACSESAHNPMSQILLDLPACFGTALMIGKYLLSSPAFIGHNLGTCAGVPPATW